MKKIFCLFIIAVLTFSLSSCGGANTVDEGKKLVAIMSEMLNSEGYISTLMNNVSEYSGTVNKLKAGDYSSPSAVYDISVNTDDIWTNGVEQSQFPQLLKDYLKSAGITSFVSRINIPAGMNSVAVSSALSAQRTFVNNSIKNDLIYLYTFVSGCPIVITFICGEDGAVRAVGNFLVNDRFSADSEQSVTDSLIELGFSDVDVKKIK